MTRSKAGNEAKPALSAEHQTAIDEFCDSLWLEDGLAKNSLEAYRRDMTLFALWLQEQPDGKSLFAVHAGDLNAYFLARHDSSKATSSNRRLAVLKRFYLLALRQNRISADPCLHLRSAKQAPRFPKILSEAQVEALLAAPDVATPLGLRDRTMLELMYASGLRVSELVLLKSLEVGRKSSPMPSTIQLPDLVESTPSLMYCGRMEPTGSAKTISVFGECSAK